VGKVVIPSTGHGLISPGRSARRHLVHRGGSHHRRNVVIISRASVCVIEGTCIWMIRFVCGWKCSWGRGLWCPPIDCVGFGARRFLESHSTTQTLTTRTHTHPYEYTYANPTPMSTSKGLSTGRSGDSRSHPMNTRTQTLPLRAPPKN
jgi:hypothetical protein